VAQALMLPLLAVAGLYFLYFQTLPALKPGNTWTAALWVSASLMIATGTYQLVSKLREIAAPAEKIVPVNPSGTDDAEANEAPVEVR
jgi:hypothetical protein